MAFDSLPEKITFTIDKIEFTGDKSFEFSLDVSDYEKKLASSPEGHDKRGHKTIGNVRNTTIYLERVHYGDQGNWLFVGVST